jgi:uncharacterized protein
MSSVIPVRLLHACLAAILVAGFLVLVQAARAAGSVSLTALGSAYTENFDALASSGTSSTTPNGWAFLETGSNANAIYTAGTGSSNTGDTYSFGATASTERAFGGLQSGTLNPTIGASFTNNTGSNITSLAISYTGEQWRLGTSGRTDRIDFQLSTNATSLNTGSWTDYNSLDFSGPISSGTVGALNGNLAANRTAISFTITGLSIPDGTTFWIRWLSFDASGADDGMSVDDFSLTPSSTEQPPSVSNTVPADGAANVPLNNNITITFSEPVNVTDPWFTLTCASSGSHTATVSGGPTTFTLNPVSDFVSGESCTLTVIASQVTDQDGVDPPDNMTMDFTAGFTTLVLVPIHDIQGSTHISPKNGQTLTTTSSIVTALRTTGSTRGFYLQDLSPDANDATSEGLFVFTGSSSDPTTLVSAGDVVQVGGRVSEFRPAATSLTITELVGPLTINTISTGNPLPAPRVIGDGGRTPPATVIEDDATGDVETSGVFDPASDGIDFYESLEGMLVQVNDAVAVGPTSDFGSNREVPIVVDNGADAGLRTARGGIVIQTADFNPERIILNDLIAGGPTLPPVNVGDSYPGTTVGLIDYSFGNFKLEVTSLPPLSPNGLQRETATAAGTYELTVGTFNVENLAPTDPPGKFETLADLIVNHLLAPDVLAIEEIQDNNGTTNDGTVDASTTWSMLISAIQATGGPAYDYRQIDPVNGTDGGAPGGNIRQGFLFRTDRGLSFIDRLGAGSTTANSVVGTGAGTQLQYSPGRIDPTNAAFNASRKPLAGEFSYFGHHLFLIANHFNSKGGDQPLFGHFQPPTRSTEVQRHQQAQVENDFVDAIAAGDPNADVIVLGDLNDFEFSDTVSILEGTPAVLNDLMSTLSPDERYSYVFEGNSQTLDHTLFSNDLFDNRPFAYDVVHVNSEFADQASDHEPQVVGVTLNDAPTADAGGPYSVNEGSSVVVSATGTDFENGALTYAWDLDNNGSFETPGQSATFSAPANSAPATLTIKVQVTDDGGLSAVDSATVNVIFNFAGFFQPVDNQPTLNLVKAGQAIPVKFSLGGDQGLSIFAAGYPKSEQITCDASEPVDGIEETVPAGGSSLSYDPVTDRYTYVWKTDKAWANTCRQLVLKLTDGTFQRADFQFTK